MKKLLFFICVFVLVSCSKDDDVATTISSTAKELGLTDIQLSKNANSNDIGFFVTNSGDTITLKGDKDEDGNTLDINILHFTTSEDDISIRFNDDKYPQLIETKTGVSIAFEWLNTTKALVNIHDANSNTYISTIWYTDSIPDPVVASKAKTIPVVRKGDAEMFIKPYVPSKTSQKTTRAISVDDVNNKLCIFSTSECDVMTDLSTWISLWNSKTHKYIENIDYSSKEETGVYHYVIPASSFPAKATNQDLCKHIDWALQTLQVGCSFLASISGLSNWISIACASTGIGVPPAAVLKAITTVAVVGSVSLEVFLAANGTSGLMATCNPKWYYQEYVVADLELHPYIITKTNVIDCEKVIVTPESGTIYIHYDVDGEPAIDNFTLTPAYPSAGQSYVATGNFHCVPEGSTIVMNIIGTDGYTDTENHINVNSNGTVELWVPGAATGVYDVCTITITTPNGVVYSMQASLVFGA